MQRTPGFPSHLPGTPAQGEHGRNSRPPGPPERLPRTSAAASAVPPPLPRRPHRTPYRPRGAAPDRIGRGHPDRRPPPTGRWARPSPDSWWPSTPPTGPTTPVTWVPGATRLVYASPAPEGPGRRHIHQRPRGPPGLDAEEEAALPALGLAVPPITVAAVRTGDTRGHRGKRRSGAAAMVKDPADLLGHDARESLSPGHRGPKPGGAQARRACGRETVIVDEIHALARDFPPPRGFPPGPSPWSAPNTSRPVPGPSGIGLSRPPSGPSNRRLRLLTGVGPGRSTAIVDCGHARRLDRPHRTSGDRTHGGGLHRNSSARSSTGSPNTSGPTGPPSSSSTPGGCRSGWPTSWPNARAPTTWPPTTAAPSKDRRLRVETRLRAGDLQALVSTASLELGIDIGPVELVCQVKSPRAIATSVAARRTFEPQPPGNAWRGSSSLDPRRTGRVRRFWPPSGGPAAVGRHPSTGGAPRHPGPADRGRGGCGREGSSNSETLARPPARPIRRG